MLQAPLKEIVIVILNKLSRLSTTLELATLHARDLSLKRLRLLALHRTCERHAKFTLVQMPSEMPDGLESVIRITLSCSLLRLVQQDNELQW